MATIKSVHVLVVVLFLALTALKALLLLLNKHQMLEAVQRRTRVFDMIFGGLMVATGLYMAFALGLFSHIWLLVKLALLLVSVPLAIIGLRRHQKWPSLLSVMVLASVYTISETKTPLQSSESQKPEQHGQTKAPATGVTTEAAPDTAAAVPAEILTQLDDNTRANAAQLYATLCARCHGIDGVPVFPGAPNLKELTCPKRAITGTIYSGRGQMPSFANVLTRGEISRLADYVQSMQEK